MPCGHEALCKICAEDFFKCPQKPFLDCPMCRSKMVVPFLMPSGLSKGFKVYGTWRRRGRHVTVPGSSGLDSAGVPKLVLVLRDLCARLLGCFCRDPRSARVPMLGGGAAHSSVCGSLAAVAAISGRGRADAWWYCGAELGVRARGSMAACASCA
eukprot:CAMPEP_0206281224 /NCGR_PEP_ID=MMETSP0047_2-20121206/39017_1 /ASSEMBLY_ACC=CAM_ASM_000192 /TAXON_ID=195065 /ORGANISM="Chroomonas mesostigmatica_cf, Strain CCMP1168" /LENGTH=154 /DNA_ID=CAMNT_0053711377 /DNA_START=90 /DNA_END=554 /DNA_ORIENTATION=+